MKNKPLYKGYPYVLLCMYNRSFPVDYIEPIEHYLIGKYDSIFYVSEETWPILG